MGCFEGHIALERRPDWIVIHATDITPDDIVNIGRLLGVIKDE